MEVRVYKSPSIEEVQTALLKDGEIHVWDRIDSAKEVREFLSKTGSREAIITKDDVKAFLGDINPLGCEIVVLSRGRMTLEIGDTLFTVTREGITVKNGPNIQDQVPRRTKNKYITFKIVPYDSNLRVELETYSFNIPKARGMTASSDAYCQWFLPSRIRWISYTHDSDIEAFYQKHTDYIVKKECALNIVFYEFFNRHSEGNFSFDDYVECMGFTGVEACTLELAAVLSSMGHRVTICVVPFKGGDVFVDAHGIRYCAIDKVGEWGQVDVFVPHCFPFDYYPARVYDLLDKNKTKIVTWFHHRLANNVFNGHELLVRAGFDVRFAYPSHFASKPFYLNDFTSHQAIINGAINPALFPSTFPSTEIKKGNWVFHADVNRGLPLSLDAFKKVREVTPDAARTFVIATNSIDVKAIDLPEASKFIGSIGKKSLVDLLVQSDYFVYGLTNEKDEVYHDTFSQCVLEAMACGVIVLTWDVACMREVYGDLAVLLEPPEFPGYSPSADTGINSAMNSDPFVKKVIALERNPDAKEALRRRAFEWASRQTWESRAMDFLRLIKNK